MKKIKFLLSYIMFFLTILIIPILIHFIYFITAEPNSDLKIFKQAEFFNFHLFLNDDFSERSISDRINNPTLYDKINKFLYLTNLKYKIHNISNPSEIKNFIIIYIILLIIFTHLSIIKNYRSIISKVLLHITIISALSVFFLSFIMPNTKIFQIFNIVEKIDEKIYNEIFAKHIDNKIKYPELKINSEEDLKYALNLRLDNTANALKGAIQIDIISYQIIAQRIFFSFSSDLINIGQNSSERKNNIFFNELSYFYDCLLIFNYVFIFILIFSKKINFDIRVIIRLFIFINSATLAFSLYNSIINYTEVFNNNYNIETKMAQYLTTEKEFITKIDIMKKVANESSELQYILFTNQMIILLFTFLLLHKDIIFRIKELINENNFKILITITSILFLLQALLVSFFNVYVLFSIIIYIIFYLRDNIKIEKINMFIVVVFSILLIKEIIKFVIEIYLLSEINLAINKFIYAPERTFEFVYDINLSEYKSLKITDYYSKSLSILLSILFYFLIVRRKLLSPPEKSKISKK